MAIESEARPTRWSGSALLLALEQTAARFEPLVPAINALNVFPVPDGDTGTNMFATLQAACRELLPMRGAAATAGAVLGTAAHGALMGARGNSGVILYQIMLGLAEASDGAEALDGQLLAAGLERAVVLAYQAVVTPVEGTILSVLRDAATGASEAASSGATLADVLGAAATRAEEALARTPDQLPILKQAAVVDAGGQGLVVLIDGLRRAARGETAVGGPTPAIDVPAAMTFLDMPEIVHELGEYGYCTNFVVTGDCLPLGAVRERLGVLGGSMVVVGDATAIKVHIHSEHPGLILEAALEYGALRDVRIDNMTAQTMALLARRQASGSSPRSEVTTTRIGIVAVASGEGLAEALLGLGVSAIVAGGPTVNPSTQEILAAVAGLDAEAVIILPNDGNVIPTARQVERLTDKQLRVVPTSSIPQAICALAAFNPTASLDENADAMTAALALVRSLALTTAARDAEIGGITARKGQYLGLLDGEMRVAGDDPVSVVLGLLDAGDAVGAELLTLFTGQPATEELAEVLSRAIAERFPQLGLEIVPGGQPHYHLIGALE